MYKLVALTFVAILAVSLGGNPRDSRDYSSGGMYNNQQQPQRQNFQNQNQYQNQNQQFQNQRNQYQQPNQQYQQQQNNQQYQFQQPQQVRQQYQPQQQQQSQYNQHQNQRNYNVRKLTRDDAPEASNPLLSPEYLQAYREFTLDLLRQSYYDDAHERTGVVAYSTFTVGHLLAIINERVLNVPNAGIQRVLRLNGQDVPAAYAGIVDTFLEDPQIEASSNFYTPDANQQVTPNYPRLHVAKQVLQLYQNPRASSVINEDIRGATHSVIDNLVVPEVPPFNQTVAGVFANTVYYNNRWVYPFTQVGERPFHVTPSQTVQVQTLEVQASLPVTVHDRYSAVAIPLEGGLKHIVLVQPRGSIKQFLRDSVADVFLHTPQTWQQQVVQVQVPALNFTLGRNFVAQLNDLAGSEVQCPGRVGVRDDVVPVHYLQPIVQVYSSFFTAQGFELAAANGVQVEREVNVQPPKTVRGGYDNVNERVYSPSVVNLNTLNVKTAREIDAVNAAAQVRANTEFVFNRPYFVYAHDVKLGAVSFTAVRNPVYDQGNRRANQVPVSQYGQRARGSRARENRHILSHFDFDEESKQYRWNCGVHNDHNVGHVHEQGHVHPAPAHPSRPVVEQTTQVPTCAPVPVAPVQGQGQGQYYRN